MPWDVWLIFLLLGVVVPWRGRARLRELLAKPVVGVRERLSLYASTIAFQWIAAGVAGWRAWARGFTAPELGLTIHDRWKIVLATVVGAGVIASLHWFNLRRMGRSKTKLRGDLRELAERILPQSPMETLPFIALAVTAGICEEFLYRGFAMAALARAGLPVGSVVLLSSVLFGLAHLYQGRSGLLGTMILGILFGAARVSFGSLAPVVVWHAAVDVVAGVVGRRYLTQTDAAVEPLR